MRTFSQHTVLHLVVHDIHALAVEHSIEEREAGTGLDTHATQSSASTHARSPRQRAAAKHAP
eukprot:6173393-Pleurochrysis_carterae.AAC.2